MATHKLAILVEAIGAAKAAQQLKGVDAAVSRIGSRAGQGIRTLTGNLMKLGAVAAVGIGAAVQSGLSDLAELESATTSVDGAIKQMGLTGKTSGAQVAGWANEIESSVQAAFDDKAIVAGAAGLIRYGKVSEKNLKPAMVVMTDLAAMTGDVDSAAKLLGKALADPAKASGKLAKAGVILTKAEIAQIKAFDKAGNSAEAQAVLLRALERTTKGAAEAINGPYRDAMLTLGDVSEDARKALAVGFLPVLTKLADKLRKGLADENVMRNIREFGEGLASGLDSLIGIAEKLPWSTIGDSLKLAGTGARTMLGAFTSLPPWVQTAVLTGWGLNKLTGGALGGIVGELGKGLIKGVLGMNAGIVNAKAGVVNVIGGGVGGGAAAGAAGFTAVSAAAVVGILGSAAVVSWLAAQELVATTTLEERRKEGGLRAEQYKGSDAVMTGPAPAALPAPLGPPVPPGLTNAKLQGPASMMLNMPGMAGIYSRAVAAGFKPSASSLQKTMERNVARAKEAAEATRKAAAAQAIATSAQRVLTSITNARLATIASKSTTPIVNVSTGFNVAISVRDTVVRTAVRQSYGNIGTANRVGVS